ncbi:MAG: hypothetical protein U1D54_03875 [Limnobacter sp.]|nr:hypothetical protein [Limnobacter sp.]
MNEDASLVKYEPPKCDECGRKIVVLSDLCAKCADGIELNGKKQANRPGTNPLPSWPKPPAPPNPPPAPAVAQCRGYALLGSGNYLLNHSDDFHPELGAELIITLASNKDKEGNRQIGETRYNPNHRQPIQPEDMVVRIGFLNERGLFALENRLAEIRKQFFADHPAPAVAQKPVGEFAGWQRRYKFPSTPGQICAWEQCSAKEATDPFEKKPAYEYRKIYTEAPAVAVNEQLLEVIETVANNLGEFAGQMETQQKADQITVYASELFAAAESAKGAV